MLTTAAIDLGALLQAVLASVVAGVGLMLVLTVSVLGFARGPALRDQGRPGAGAMWTAVGVVALAGALGGIAWGLAMVAEGGPLG
jgi:hypothetical protein